jgi:two-component system chemotaxis response regulator CheY
MNKTVMIVDDSALICRQVTLALSPSGFDVLQARDGVDALEQLSKSPQVALIICDVNMPKMDGMEFLEHVRDTPSATVPVIMLTTESDPALLARAKALGAKCWITKPFRADTIVETARKLTTAA